MRRPHGEHTRLARRRIRSHPDRLATSAHHSLSLGQGCRRTPRSAAHQEQRRSYQQYHLFHTGQQSPNSPQRTMGSPPQDDFGKQGPRQTRSTLLESSLREKTRADPLRRVRSSATFRRHPAHAHAPTTLPCHRRLFSRRHGPCRPRHRQRVRLARARRTHSRDAAPRTPARSPRHAPLALSVETQHHDHRLLDRRGRRPKQSGAE